MYSTSNQNFQDISIHRFAWLEFLDRLLVFAFEIIITVFLYRRMRVHL